MSKVMKQIPFEQLMDRILTEYEQKGSVFGVRKPFSASAGGGWEIFGEQLDAPFGPAAGPHTQLAQNLIAAYAAGARFFEIKTVQALDGEDLPVSKPCILAPDECYNVEWSTELYVPQAMDEYIKGWFAIKLLAREFGAHQADGGAHQADGGAHQADGGVHQADGGAHQSDGGAHQTDGGAHQADGGAVASGEGFVFNMSVGYDLEGIKTEKIDRFIEGLKNAAGTRPWQACKQWALENLHRFEHIDKDYVENISPAVCRSITLSTLHGCPPHEIERIATYLLTEKKLHTFIKCNPTILGYEYARRTLDSLGFDYLGFDDHHFKADLQFEDAVPMLKRLQALADGLALSFGVKLTNTFPVQITGGELPGEEMYMSGRALFPLSAEVANRLSKAFDGKLRISYSGGADVNNICNIYDAGIWPITLATTLLKPGGYQRLAQISEKLTEMGAKPFAGVNLEKLQALVDKAGEGKLYRKPAGRLVARKMEAHVPLLDCFEAPCRDGCPFGQDVPAYLRLVGEGRHLEALKVITERNPLPFITGTICSHRCMDKCTRYFYEGSVDIRAVKLEAAEKAYSQLIGEIKGAQSFGVKASESSNEQLIVETGSNPETGEKVAVIGGGPAGLAAAYFLSRAGRKATIFEKSGALGGVVRHVIPEFRISGAAINNDIALVRAQGVEVRLNSELGVRSSKSGGGEGGWPSEAPGDSPAVVTLEDLRAEGFVKIIIATGAWKPGALELEGGEAIDALWFLEQVKKVHSSANEAPESVGKAPDSVSNSQDSAGKAPDSVSNSQDSAGKAPDSVSNSQDSAGKAPASVSNIPEGMRLGERVVVVGGGNTAMDTARAAKRVPGVKSVSLVYRRTKRFMPADAHELELALEDGVDFRELLSPVGLGGGILTCAQMELGAPDVSGRRSPVPAGETVAIPADTVISAVGNNIDIKFFGDMGIPTDRMGRVIMNADTLESRLPGVYVIGDAARGPATVAEAIADAAKCVEAIAGEGFGRFAGLNVNPDPKPAGSKKGVLFEADATVDEPARCLECATICECCVDVCPNRANVAVDVGGRPQIIHVDWMCNECGNCETFCPYSSAPYLDKFTIFACVDDFEKSENAGFLPLGDLSALVRLDGETSIHSDGARLPDGIWEFIEAAENGVMHNA